MVVPFFKGNFSVGGNGGNGITMAEGLSTDRLHTAKVYPCKSDAACKAGCGERFEGAWQNDLCQGITIVKGVDANACQARSKIKCCQSVATKECRLANGG